jgi:AcrR family transcriptional regulator
MTTLTTRNRLKLSARQLFAQRGIDGVSVRDIVVSAGQKNAASLHYYFGTKDSLIRELVADGAKLINERRNRWLDELEASGRQVTLREIIEVLVWPSTALAGDRGEEDTYMRFITMMQMNQRELFLESLEGKWASGYQRCLTYIRKLLPEFAPELLTQRLVFMAFYLSSALSGREAALAGARGAHRVWSAQCTLHNFVDTVEGLLRQAPSGTTLAKLSDSREGRRQNSRVTSDRKASKSPSSAHPSPKA